MKGGSREAKGHKSTGGGRTWYGKRETLTPLSPSPHPPLSTPKTKAISRHLGFVEQGRLGRERNLYQGDGAWGWQNTIEPLHLRPLIVGMSSDVM